MANTLNVQFSYKKTPLPCCTSGIFKRDTELVIEVCHTNIEVMLLGERRHDIRVLV